MTFAIVVVYVIFVAIIMNVAGRLDAKAEAARMRDEYRREHPTIWNAWQNPDVENPPTRWGDRELQLGDQFRIEGEDQQR